jgi:pimeloyl-ACP methyl ester carboxylesterase
MPQKGQLVLQDGGALGYAIDGAPDAVPLLILRPAGGSIELWHELRAQCAERLRVVSFDPRGQGQSSSLPSGFSVQDMAEDAVRVLDRLDIGRAHVFGESMGGMVALELALAHPERVGRLVLASTLTRGRPVDLAAIAEGAKVAACLLEDDGAVQACEIERTVSTGSSGEAAGRVARAKRLAQNLDPRRDSLIGYAAAMARVDFRDRLGAVQAPALVIGGIHDRLAPPSEAARLASLLPVSKLELIDAGHDLALEKADVCAEAILRFVAPDDAGERFAVSEAQTITPPGAIP